VTQRTSTSLAPDGRRAAGPLWRNLAGAAINAADLQVDFRLMRG